MRPPSSSFDGDSFRGSEGSSERYSGRYLYHQRNGIMSNVSEYKVEHLTTLSMQRKEAVLTVEDSIRKLQILDANGKIWPQELYMKIDDKTVRLTDCDSAEVMEQFHLSQIHHVQPIINACIYDSICAIVVRNHSAPDIHLFQCFTVPADIICADIGSALFDLKNKKGKKSRPETLQRYKDRIEASRIPLNGAPVNVRNKVVAWSIKADHADSIRPSNGQPSSSAEMMIIRVHRDVDLLNHALDDIETFVSMLQKSAVAARELSEQQNQKKSRSSRKQGGSGILEARAKLPSKEKFLDILQKFRFCFNLLSKLKEQIKDPNSVELTHFLFQPLAMIVKSFCGFELPRTIKSPLFHEETLVFLRNCTTTQEMELLERLGDFWIRSRNEFPKEMYFPPYVPRFMSGWIPPPLPMMEHETRDLSAAVALQAKKQRRRERAWRTNGSQMGESILYSNPDITPTQMRQNGFQTSYAFKQHVQDHVARNQSFHAPPRKLCRALYDFSARSEGELSVNLDELLDVLDDSKDDWWMVKNYEGEVGYVPAQLVLSLSQAGKSAPVNVPQPPPPPPNITTQHPAPIPTPPAPVVAVAPAIVPVAAPAPVIVPPSPPKPPPPPKVTPIPPASKLTPIPVYTAVKKPPTKKMAPKRGAVPVSDTMQEELRQRVANQKKQPNFVLPKKTGSSNLLVIDRSSSSTDVVNWLLSLGFSNAVVSSMGVLNGEQIFDLKREEIKEICGDEGSRVYSQLMIQRSMDGYATIRAKSELKSVLQKFRESIDEKKEESEKEADEGEASEKVEKKEE